MLDLLGSHLMPCRYPSMSITTAAVQPKAGTVIAWIFSDTFEEGYESGASSSAGLERTVK